jgi:hypothetical protein
VRRKHAVEKKLGHLLYEICVEWGFCLPPADEFATEVPMAEGFDPEYELSWHRRIGQRFRDRYGESVSAEDGRFSDSGRAYGRQQSIKNLSAPHGLNLAERRPYR